MEAEQRIQALEQEVQILKTQIQSILLDIQAHLLTNAYPALRGHHTASGASSEDDEDDDEYDRASRPPKVKKASVNGTDKAAKAEKPEKAPKAAKAVKVEKAQPPVRPAEPMMASLDDQQTWVLDNIKNLGVAGTRELIENYADQRRVTPEVSDTLMRFTDMYAAAAEEQTLPSRPAGMPTFIKAYSAAPAKNQKAKPQPAAQPAVQPAAQPAPRNLKTFAAEPTPAKSPANDAGIDENSSSSIVLRLIAGVQNAGAGVRWGKKE